MAEIEPQSAEQESQQQANGLLDRTTVLVKKFNLYLATLATMAGSWFALHNVAKVQEKYIYLLVSVPFLILILCEILPSWYKKRQLDSLTALGMSGQVAQAGYFRLDPYQERDQDKFFRADNAHEKVFNWLLTATTPLLYLSGRSGTGKSSLLASWVLPKLREQQYQVLSLRAYHDPLIALQKQLCAKGVIWQNGREATESVEVLLRKACEKLSGQTLLLVFDQFEELTIIQDVEIQKRFAEFLQALIAQPVKNLKLLAVLRSDYLGKLDDLHLPPIRQQENWQEIAPFDYAAARRFLQDSGLNLSPALLDKVLAEAGDIEENPGLLRPITLNMLGVVLQRFGGGTLQGTEPGKLIRSYLREAVTESEVREIAPPVLRQMVTDAGTKIAMAETALAAKTKIEKGTLRGCLVRLGSRGLVREVDEQQRVWEVSHDFIARLLGQLLAGLLPSWWRRFRPALVWSGLVLWFVALLVAYPAYQEWEYKRGRQLISDFGIRYRPEENGQIGVEIDRLKIEKISDEVWQTLSHDKDKIVSLIIAVNDNLSQLPALNSLTALQTLEISNNDLSQLPALNSLTALQTLDISWNTNLTQLPALNSLTALQTLTISGNDNLTQLPALNSLTALQSLRISENQSLTQLPVLNGLRALQTLEISNNTGLTQLPTVDSLQNLVIVVSQKQQGLNTLQLHKLVSLKKLFLSDDKTNRIFAELLNQQRQQQGLNAVEIVFTDDYVNLEEKLKKLKQP